MKGRKTGKENPPTMNYSYMLLSFFLFPCLSSHHSRLKLWDCCSPRLSFTRVTLSSSHLCSHCLLVHLPAPQTWIKTSSSPLFFVLVSSRRLSRILQLNPPSLENVWQMAESLKGNYWNGRADSSLRVTAELFFCSTPISFFLSLIIFHCRCCARCYRPSGQGILPFKCVIS